MGGFYDHRSFYFDYSKVLDDIPTTIRILSTPTDLCVFVSQEDGLIKSTPISDYENKKRNDIYLFSEDLHSFLKNKKITGDKRLLVFCLARDIKEITKELENVLSGDKKLCELQNIKT